MARASDLCIALVLLSLLIGIFTLSAQALHVKQHASARRASEVAVQVSIQASLLQQIFERGDGLQSVVAKEALVCRDDEEQKLCPVTCFRPDPVCGEDGVTYWCGCHDAQCAGVAVLHIGYCKIRSSAFAEKGSQALILLHALWLVLLGFSCLFGLL